MKKPLILPPSGNGTARIDRAKQRITALEAREKMVAEKAAKNEQMKRELQDWESRLRKMEAELQRKEQILANKDEELKALEETLTGLAPEHERSDPISELQKVEKLGVDDIAGLEIARELLLAIRDNTRTPELAAIASEVAEKRDVEKLRELKEGVRSILSERRAP